MAVLSSPLKTSADMRLGVGVVLTLAGLVLAGALTHSTLLLAPFAATAALKHAAPHGEMARPRNVVGGYLIGAGAGLAVGLFAPGEGLAAALAAGVAATAMARLDLDHPPAVAMAVLAVQQPVPWVLQATGAGALAVTAMTVVLSPVLHRRTYPRSLAHRVNRATSA